MKKKEMKSLAQRIAKAEYIVDTSNDEQEIREAQDIIMSLSNRIEGTDDILAIDEMVQEILSKNFD